MHRLWEPWNPSRPSCHVKEDLTGGELEHVIMGDLPRNVQNIDGDINGVYRRVKCCLHRSPVSISLGVEQIDSVNGSIL